MEDERIKIALINGSKSGRQFDTEEFAKVEGVKVVYTAQDTKTGFKEMLAKKPDVIVVSVGYPDTRTNDLDPKFIKIRSRMPKTKILLVTELPQDHPFIAQTIETGTSVIDDRFDVLKRAEALRRIKTGEQVIAYAPSSHNLETYRPSRGEAKEG